MYTNPLQFEIQYECSQHLQHGAQRVRRVSRLGSQTSAPPLPPRGTAARGPAPHLAPADGCASVAADLEWKITYVGSAEDDRFDQVLDSVLVGPVTPGPFRFVFQARGVAAAAARRGSRAPPAARS